jgi:hypothetical protein
MFGGESLSVRSRVSGRTRQRDFRLGLSRHEPGLLGLVVSEMISPAGRRLREDLQRR